jgi:pyruvate/2-oxoglutarate/acetoin dehydrogenase E1 component
VHEDTRTGGIGESLAAVVQEEAFEYLDAPVRILGSLDTPVPYSPPLEEAFLPSEEEVDRAAPPAARVLRLGCEVVGAPPRRRC